MPPPHARDHAAGHDTTPPHRHARRPRRTSTARPIASTPPHVMATRSCRDDSAPSEAGTSPRHYARAQTSEPPLPKAPSSRVLPRHRSCTVRGPRQRSCFLPAVGWGRYAPPPAVGAGPVLCVPIRASLHTQVLVI
ncbi:hypothetical protein PVAP13_3NG266600 [Panicum virgatum]|uniref:Uncharacterized protein n=1 Tax=Panicum virgatum TaxID=38727 RepID=A0A8T0UPZ4_PANVG|nr:hypothetical protein PVAP13_3NG266600 [Panicum virgatum]KAG2622389.1 hypothetical protein PVAP13_3NG266600 [Panicum virgatum]